MLTDFDLSKQSSPAGEPTVVKTGSPSMPPAIDTKSCIANLRTNSFVGTEGKRFVYHSGGRERLRKLLNESSQFFYFFLALFFYL